MDTQRQDEIAVLASHPAQSTRPTDDERKKIDVPLEGRRDDGTPVINRAMAIMAKHASATTDNGPHEEEKSAQADPFADIAAALDCDHHVQTQAAPARPAALNATQHKPWATQDPCPALRPENKTPRKLHGGHMHVAAPATARALARRATDVNTAGEVDREAPEKRTEAPALSLDETSYAHRGKLPTDRQKSPTGVGIETPGKTNSEIPHGALLSSPGEGGDG